MDATSTTYEIDCLNSQTDQDSSDPTHHSPLDTGILECGIEQLASNADTQLLKLKCGNQVVLATLNNKEYNNSYVLSPYTMFVSVGKKSIGTFDNFLARAFSNFGLTLIGAIHKFCKINQLIQINSRLSSLNLYHNNVINNLDAITNTLVKKYPQHAIQLQCVNEVTDPELMKKLEHMGYLLVPIKLTNFYRDKSIYMKRSHTKRDFSVLRNTKYTVIKHDELTIEDMKRIHELYQILFIQKHSEHNLDYTVQFFEQAWKNKWYTFTALRSPEGKIDGFITYKRHNNVTACGPLGYDTNLPSKLGLYRMLFALNLQPAVDEDLTYNMGSANDLYKVNRGSERVLDHYAIYCKHLSLHRRFPWLMMRFIYKHIAIKILLKKMF